MTVYDFNVNAIDGELVPMKHYEGQVLLIVNTASQCGLTPHYEGLQKLYDEYKDQGFVVLGFPCNQFAGQEPGTDAEIQHFCETNYKVTFPMFSKINVKGELAHPLYQYLVEHTPEPYRTGDIEWNFVKFLINREGEIVKQYSARTEPADLEIDIKKEL